MKNILFIVAIMLTSIAQCQMTSNIISKTDFYNIKINNITLSSIKLVEGSETKIRSLILLNIEEKNINTGERGPSNYWYKYDGFEIAFTDNSGTPNHPGIAMFKITNNKWNFTVQGKTITIGSDISILGNINFNTQRNGDKSIIYQYCDGCNNFIYIDFNQTTKKITEIGFIEQT